MGAQPAFARLRRAAASRARALARSLTAAWSWRLSARVTVKRASGGDEETLDSGKADIFPSNEKGLMASDHCALIHLNEPCILENTRLRFTCAAAAQYSLPCASPHK